MTMTSDGKHYTVGQLAKATDTKAVTIRYYERLGLLPSAGRTAAGYRLYTAEKRDRLLFIRRSRALGFSLNAIRQLLDLADRRQASCAEVDAKVEEQLAQVRARIRDLRALEAELERLSACCEGGVIDDCRIIESLSVSSERLPAPR
jgi:DNA-binding transcriptional MerR regulator